MADWIDNMSPAEARKFMKSRVPVVEDGKDEYGRRRVKQAMPLALRDLDRIRVKAGTE